MSSAIKSSAIKERLSNINHVATLYKTMVIFGIVFYLCYIFFHVTQPNWTKDLFSVSTIEKTLQKSNATDSPTHISHLLIGLIGSEKGWYHRKDYIESWWRPNEMRGYLHLDEDPEGELVPWSSASPPYRVSDNLTKFLEETNASAPVQIRMVHGIMETVREYQEGFRWLVMGDDDSIFFVDNMVDVLAKYDHTKYYYFGGQSEFILSNYWLSFNMGFGGAGLIFSYPLAKALANDMESCLRRYAYLDSADHITMMCIADIGVNLSPHKGIHQIDLRGNISGFLSYHPKSLLMSLHHFDMIEPIFPTMNRSESTRHLMKSANADQSRLLQQTICYHIQRNWSISISWGYSVHIYEKVISRGWLQNPIETFNTWVDTDWDPPHYMFNTRLLSNDSCEAPHVFFFQSTEKVSESSIFTSYNRSSSRDLPPCEDGSYSADYVSHIHVYSPALKRIEIDRCECCDVASLDGTNYMTIKLRECRPNEIIA
ncbi:hypothetical protein ACH5RR_009244 [Cinchona calisaya]|uniref:Uncharacterized protein n=1 Tax=Cinchona calisaya TaxID=153742 RepID=A0ABD3AH86_9GENT